MSEKFDSLMTKMVVVGVILGGLIVAGRYGWKRQERDWRDAARKDDLLIIEQAAHKYFRQYKCYFPEEIMKDCGGKGLEFQIKGVPCDPVTGEPYGYELPDEDCAESFRLYAQLENTESFEVEKAGCREGCGRDRKYNYKLVRWPVFDY